MSSGLSASAPLVRTLESNFPLSDAEREAVLNLPIQVAEIRADQDIVREGDRPSRCALMLDGHAAPKR